MMIDLIYALLLVLATIKGFQRGLIVGLFSFVALVVGLAAALKLSSVVAGYLADSVNISAEWLPFVAFLVVFIEVVLLIRLGAKAIESAVEVVMMGWLNRLGGILLYIAMYTLVYSVLLFYAGKMGFIQPETIEKSITFSWIEPLGPKVIGVIGQLIPWFKDLFGELTAFFEKVSHELPPR
jgi:membrane protein required for colicin V production